MKTDNPGLLAGPPQSSPSILSQDVYNRAFHDGAMSVHRQVANLSSVPSLPGGVAIPHAKIGKPVSMVLPAIKDVEEPEGEDGDDPEGEDNDDHDGGDDDDQVMAELADMRDKLKGAHGAAYTKAALGKVLKKLSLAMSLRWPSPSQAASPLTMWC